MILNFWDHPHFIIAENACDVTNNTWPHKQIEIFLECFTTYIIFGQIAVNRGAQLTMFVWVMELLLDTARSGIGKDYKCRIGYILDTILDKANNTQKKLILKTLSQSF